MNIRRCRVLVDARCLQHPALQFRGVGHFSASLLRHIPTDLRPNLHLTALCDTCQPDMPIELASLFDEVLYRQPILNPSDDSVIFLNLSPMTAEPWVFERLLDSSNVLSATIVYDFIPLDYPGYIEAAEVADYYNACLAAMSKYKLFFSISNYTADRLIAICGVESDRSFVTRIGARDIFFLSSEQDDDHGREEVLSFIDGLEKFAVVSAGGDIRKNINTATQAVLSVANRRHERLGLLISGKYIESQKQEILDKVQDLHLDPTLIRFLPYISDEALAWLYRHAVASISPSLIEGFSMPVIEAMASGGIAVVSDIPAHRELIHDPAYRFPATDVAALSALLEHLLDNPEAVVAARAVQQAAVEALRESIIGARLWEPLLEAVTKFSSRPSKVMVPGPRRLPRVAFFTPYPNQNNGVGLYSAATVRALSSRLDIELFTDAKVPGDEARFVRAIHGLGERPRLANFDATFFVIGNSDAHLRIIDLARQYGGPMIIHDSRLFEIFRWAMGNEDFATYASRLLKRHVSAENVQAWLHDPKQLAWPFLDDLMKRADSIIVHSRLLQQNLSDYYDIRPHYIPHALLKSFSDEDLMPKRRLAARERLGIVDNVLALGSFGVATETKGVFESVMALRDLSDWGISANLWFVGGVENHLRDRLVGCAQRFGVADSIKFSGRVTEAAYEDYLVGLDIGLQFRNAKFGQISGALAECVSAGMPSVANLSLARAIETPDFVLTVPDTLSPLLIAEQVANLYEQKAHKTRLWPQRAAYVVEHSFDYYAEQFAALIS